MADRKCHHWKRLMARVMNNRPVPRAIALARLRSHFLLDIIGARLAERSRNDFPFVRASETFTIHLRVLNSLRAPYVSIFHLHASCTQDCPNNCTHFSLDSDLVRACRIYEVKKQPRFSRNVSLASIHFFLFPNFGQSAGQGKDSIQGEVNF